jgi:transposase
MELYIFLFLKTLIKGKIMSGILVSMEVESLKKEITELKRIQQNISEDIKERVLNELRLGTSCRKLALQIGLHPTTIQRWKKQNFSINPRTSQPNILDEKRKEEFTLKENVHLQQKSLFYLWPALVIIFVLAEYYLFKENISYQKLLGKKDHLLIASLSELIPLLFSSLLVIKVGTKSERALMTFSLILSFFYSAYCSSGKNLNMSKDGLNALESLKRESLFIANSIRSKEKSMEFYRGRPQSDGSIGWPITVNRLQREVDQLAKSKSSLEIKMRNFGDRKIKEYNLYLDLIFKLIIQMCSLILVGIISRRLLFGKLANNVIKEEK